MDVDVQSMATCVRLHKGTHAEPHKRSTRPSVVALVHVNHVPPPLGGHPVELCRDCGELCKSPLFGRRQRLPCLLPRRERAQAVNDLPQHLGPLLGVGGERVQEAPWWHRPPPVEPLRRRTVGVDAELLPDPELPPAAMEGGRSTTTGVGAEGALSARARLWPDPSAERGAAALGVPPAVCRPPSKPTIARRAPTVPGSTPYRSSASYCRSLSASPAATLRLHRSRSFCFGSLMYTTPSECAKTRLGGGSGSSACANLAALALSCFLDTFTTPTDIVVDDGMAATGRETTARPVKTVQG